MSNCTQRDYDRATQDAWDAYDQATQASWIAYHDAPRYDVLDVATYGQYNDRARYEEYLVAQEAAGAAHDEARAAAARLKCLDYTGSPGEKRA